MVSQNQLCNLGCSCHRQGWEGRDPGGVCHSGDFHPPPFPAPRTSWAPASPCSVVLPATDVSRCCVAIFPELKQFFLPEDSEGLRLSIHKAYRLRILENPQSPKVIEALKELLGEESPPRASLYLEETLLFVQLSMQGAVGMQVWWVFTYTMVDFCDELSSSHPCSCK